jgi:hypothetical protein
MTQLEIARQYSDEQLVKLRGILHTAGSANFAIVVGGSLARGEASEQSDIDYFLFGDDERAVNNAKALLAEKYTEIKNVIGYDPSADGAFGDDASETLEQLTSNIGGNDDKNQKITRRILFLLEGTWLTSSESFSKYRNAVLNRYVSTSMRDEQLCRFLLNDIIRYYRTICVDFEFKTAEGGKAWGIRYIKLRFSRKLLYFSGLIAVAETANLPADKKLKKLEDLLNMTPIDRIQHACGTRADKALSLYDYFLSQVSDKDVRNRLKEVTNDPNTHSEEFTSLRKVGHDFSDALADLLKTTYCDNHPIHQAIIF